jgi:hypothetical protein
MIAAMAFGLAMRRLALRFDWHMPKFVYTEALHWPDARLRIGGSGMRVRAHRRRAPETRSWRCPARS